MFLSDWQRTGLEAREGDRDNALRVPVAKPFLEQVGMEQSFDSAENGGVFQQHFQAFVGRPIAITPTGVNGEIVS